MCSYGLKRIKFVPVGSGGISPPFLASALHGSERSTSHPGRFTPKEIDPGIHWIVGWVGPQSRFGRCGHCLESNPDLPAHSPSQNRLSYSHSCYNGLWYCNFASIMFCCCKTTFSKRETPEIKTDHTVSKFSSTDTEMSIMPRGTNACLWHALFLQDNLVSRVCLPSEASGLVQTVISSGLYSGSCSVRITTGTQICLIEVLCGFLPFHQEIFGVTPQY
jgi:hypothetical protein